MATIFYGLSGEGRGHATRARTIAQALGKRHRVVVFAPDLGYELLEPAFRGTGIDVHPIRGLQFAYDPVGRVRLLGTAAQTADFALHMASNVEKLMPMFDRYQPDLVVADFEPLLPRAARLVGVPFVSFDHQHYLVANDLSMLPLHLRLRARLAAPCVAALYDWQVHTVISSFYNPPLRAGVRDTSQIGVLLRPELLRRKPRREGFLLSYMRRHPTPGLMEALRATRMPVRLYGLGVRHDYDNIRFFDVEERRFMDDLTACEAVISTAGNQLVGEALYLRKPVLAIPEAQNFEQAINAHFLEAAGAGQACWGKLTRGEVARFLADLDVYRSRIVPEAVCGNGRAVEILESLLPAETRLPVAPPAAVMNAAVAMAV